MAAWLEAHPVLVTICTIFLLPLVGAILNWVYWFPSIEAWKAYEVAHPQRARWIRLTRAIFPHLRKAFPALKEILPPSGPPDGSGDPPTPLPPPPAPRMPPMLFSKLGVAGLAFAVFALGCARPVPQTPREMARGYLAVMGMGAQAGVHACTAAASTMKAGGNPDWRPLAEECADGYDLARETLFAVEAGLDTWDEADVGKLACAAGTALQGTERIVHAMSSRGIVVSTKDTALIEDGMRLAAFLLKTYGGSCAVQPKDGGSHG